MSHKKHLSFLARATKIVVISFTLGATFFEKIHLAWFFLLSYLVRKFVPGFYYEKAFTIIGHDKRVKVMLSSDYGDLFVLSEVFIGNDYIQEELKNEPRVIFDVGSNIGFTALYFHNLYPDARIFCFEPDPDNYKKLVANTRQFKNIVPFKLGIGSKAETSVLYKSPIFHMRHSLLPRYGNTQKVTIKVISLDEAIRLASVSTVSLLKFDIEGGEYEMFKPFENFKCIESLVGEIHPYIGTTLDQDVLIAKLKSKYSTVAVSEARGKFFVRCSSLK